MATKKTITKDDTTNEVVKRYRVEQLLRMPQYNNRVARIVLKGDGTYSFAEADELIRDYMKKKG